MLKNERYLYAYFDDLKLWKMNFPIQISKFDWKINHWKKTISKFWNKLFRQDLKTNKKQQQQQQKRIFFFLNLTKLKINFSIARATYIITLSNFVSILTFCEKNQQQQNQLESFHVVTFSSFY